MRPFITPVHDHEKLPDGVPLVADFDDDRNRLSYYLPELRAHPGVRVPRTTFLEVTGSLQSYPDVEYREITRFMQDHSLERAFVRGDYASAKLQGEAGSLIDSHDPYDIESVVLELLRQLGRTKRSLGGRIAVREWIDHDAEVRFFVRDGSIVDWDSTDDEIENADVPHHQAACVAHEFDTFAWSVDFIREAETDAWYCIDMGLDGLYWGDSGWVAISEHHDPERSPEQHADQMCDPDRYHWSTNAI